LQHLVPENHPSLNILEVSLASDMPNWKYTLQTGTSEFNSALNDD